ncbi:MAG: ATP synthase F1 subunit delta [Patescibacteria group bacterium]
MRKASIRQYAEAYLGAAKAAPQKEQAKIANRLVTVLARQRQLRLVPRIAAELERLIAEQGGPLVVQVRSAKTLTAAEDTELAKNLEKALDRKVKIRHVHEAKLLAGVKIQVGDKLIDNALSSRFANLKAHLLHT